MFKGTFLFLKESKGVGAKSNKPYHFIEMHNPETLTNGTYQVHEGVTAENFKNRQAVNVDLELTSEGFNHTLRIMKISPAGG